MKKQWDLLKEEIKKQHSGTKAIASIYPAVAAVSEAYGNMLAKMEELEQGLEEEKRESLKCCDCEHDHTDKKFSEIKAVCHNCHDNGNWKAKDTKEV